MAKASIDIAAMRQLVAGMERAAELIPQYRGRLVSIMEGVGVDSSPATRLDSVAAWAYHELPGLRRRLALAVAIEAQNLTWNRQRIPFDESQVSTVPTGVATRRGRDAAAALLAAADGVLDDATLAEIQAGMNDPYFAYGFAKALSPAQLGDFVLAMSRAGDAIAGSRSLNKVEAHNEWRERYGRVLAALGTTLGTASRSRGDLRLPSDYARSWLQLITGEAKTPAGHAPGSASAAAAILLRHGVWDTEFLDAVASGVIDFEQREGRGAEHWSDQAYQGFTFVGPYASDGTRADDGLASVLYALGNNPRAAQRFFTSGGTSDFEIDGQTLSVNSRLKYLLIDRETDGLVDPERTSDKGGGLGRALAAATTAWRDREERGRTSAQIASQALGLIGERTNSGAGGWGPFVNNGWEMPEGMRGSIAQIVANYMPDVYRAADPQIRQDALGSPWFSAESSGFPPQMPYGVALSDWGLTRILGTLGQDDDHVKVMLTGAALAHQLRFSWALKKSVTENEHAPVIFIQGQSIPLATAAAMATGKTVGYVVNSAYEGHLTAVELESRREAATQDLFGSLSTIPPLRMAAGAWGEYAFDELRKQAVQNLPGAKANPNDYNKLEEGAVEDMTKSTLNLLLDGSFLDQRFHDLANKRVRGTTYHPPPAAAITTDPSGTKHFDFSSPEYSDWVSTYGGSIRGWVQDRVVNQYYAALGGID